MGVNKLLTCDSSELQSFPEMSTVISFPLLGNDWAKALGKKMKSDKAPAEHKNLSAVHAGGLETPSHLHSSVEV